MVAHTVVWESPLLTCVCAEVLGETRTNGKRNWQPRRKAPHANATTETALSWVSNIDGTLHNLTTGLQLTPCICTYSRCV